LGASLMMDRHFSVVTYVDVGRSKANVRGGIMAHSSVR
jgi:hypothetical protein